MFTGLIEAIGTIIERQSKSHGQRLKIAAPFDDLQMGESIAVNGVCLTVTAFDKGYFCADLSSESLAKCNLGSQNTGRQVNLERALRLGDRLGGHWVSGHIDGLGKIISATPSGDAIAVRVAVPDNLMKYIVPKGSITLDGASLTVNTTDAAGFDFMLIPHSQKSLHQLFAKAGHEINIEVDILGKYIEKLLSCTEAKSSAISPTSDALQEKLRSAGFM